MFYDKCKLSGLGIPHGGGHHGGGGGHHGGGGSHSVFVSTPWYPAYPEPVFVMPPQYTVDQLEPALVDSETGANNMNTEEAVAMEGMHEISNLLKKEAAYRRVMNFDALEQRCQGGSNDARCERYYNKYFGGNNTLSGLDNYLGAIKKAPKVQVNKAVQQELNQVNNKLKLLDNAVKAGKIGPELANEYRAYSACLTAKLTDVSRVCGPLSVGITAVANYIASAKKAAAAQVKQEKQAATQAKKVAQQTAVAAKKESAQKAKELKQAAAAEKKKAASAKKADVKVINAIKQEIKKVQAKLKIAEKAATQGLIKPELLKEYQDYVACLTSRLTDTAKQCGNLSVPVDSLLKVINEAKKASKIDAKNKSKISKADESKVVASAAAEIRNLAEKAKPLIAQAKSRGGPKSKAIAAQLEQKLVKHSTAVSMKGMGYLSGLEYLAYTLDTASGSCLDDSGNVVSSALCVTPTQITVIQQPAPKGCDRRPNRPICMMWQMSVQAQQTNAALMAAITDIMNMITSLIASMQQEGSNPVVDCMLTPDDPNCMQVQTGGIDCAMYPTDSRCIGANTQQPYYDPYAQAQGGSPYDTGYSDIYSGQQQQAMMDSQMAPGFETMDAGAGFDSGLPSDYTPPSFLTPSSAQAAQAAASGTAPSTDYAVEDVAATEIAPDTEFAAEFAESGAEIEPEFVSEPVLTSPRRKVGTKVPREMVVEDAVSEEQTPEIVAGDEEIYDEPGYGEDDNAIASETDDVGGDDDSAPFGFSGLAKLARMLH